MNAKAQLVKYWLKNEAKLMKKRFRIKVNFELQDNGNTLTLEPTNELIACAIRDGRPLMVARYGSNEGRLTADVMAVKLGIKKKVNKVYFNAVCSNAGFFPNSPDMAIKFGELMTKCSKNVDVLGHWDFYYSDYLADCVCRQDVKLTRLRNLEPYCSEHPWSSALKGKKVVVVHPFDKQIIHQYEKRDSLFSNKQVLPEFNLRVVKAVQTIAGEKDSRFDTWFDALQYMYDEVMSEPFDVAIIGCGAYGFPLASMIKDAGKVAIHLGGATQLLFGIMGKRWEDRDYVKALLNDSWEYPDPEFKPKNADKVENGCYW